MEEDAMKFREHRGGLAESMATEVTIDSSLDALAEHLEKVLLKAFRSGSITVKLYDERPDERIGWLKTFVVLDDHGVIGFTDQMPGRP
jgi:hypothetical protein